MVSETPQQREITRLCIQCALMLLQHGAESMVVEQLSSRLGLACWAVASLLTLATCIGVVAAMAIWGLRTWA